MRESEGDWGEGEFGMHLCFMKDIKKDLWMSFPLAFPTFLVAEHCLVFYANYSVPHLKNFISLPLQNDKVEFRGLCVLK